MIKISIYHILGLLDSGVPNGGGSLADSFAGPLLIIGIAIAAVILIGLIYIVIKRDNLSSSRASRKTHRLTKSKVSIEQEDGSSNKRRRRHKRRRRDHRKRNPTLSEVGGLPSKSEDQSKAKNNRDGAS